MSGLPEGVKKNAGLIIWQAAKKEKRERRERRKRRQTDQEEGTNTASYEIIMDTRPMGVKITGSGGFGTSRPGTAEMFKQVSAASLSSSCEETTYEADPRPRSQGATGRSRQNKNQNNNVESTNIEKKTTGAGELGGPRPGAEGIKRVPSASLSDNRGEEQVEV